MYEFLGETNTRRQRDIRWTMTLTTFLCWMVAASTVGSLVTAIVTLSTRWPAL